MITRVTPLVAGGTERLTEHAVSTELPSLMHLVRQAEAHGTGVFHASRAHTCSERWDLHTDHAGIVHACRTGWPEGLAHVRRVENDLASEHRAGTTCYAVAGTRVHVPRAVAGHPLHMLRRGAVDHRAPVVRLLVASCVPAFFDAVHARNRGAALLGAISEVESCGRRVELSTSYAARHARTTHRLVVTIKRAQDPLDADQAIIALAHPAVHRRLVFAVMEQYDGPAWRELMRHNYGVPFTVDADDYRVVPAAHEWGDWTTPAAALDSARRVFSEEETT